MTSKQDEKKQDMLRNGWDYAKRLPDNAYDFDLSPAGGKRPVYLISKDSKKAAVIFADGNVTEFVPVFDNSRVYPGGPNID